MKLAPMRFGGVSMRHNPAKLNISGKNRVHEYLSPCCEADNQVVGRELSRISGEGVLFGADCLTQYQTLERLQNGHVPAKLTLPRMQPLYAVLRELSLTAEPEENILHWLQILCWDCRYNQGFLHTLCHIPLRRQGRFLPWEPRW